MTAIAAPRVLPLFVFAASLAVIGQLLFIGVDDHDAAGPVDDDQISAADLGRDVSQSDDCRDAHGAGDDGGVACPSADVRGETFYELAIECGGLRRQQIVGNYRHFLGQMSQILVLLADQQLEQPFFDIVHVLDALGQIFVLDGRDIGGITSHRDTDGILRRRVMLAQMSETICS